MKTTLTQARLAFTAALLASTAGAAPTPGYVEDFNSGTGGFDFLGFPPRTESGGADGLADSYLFIGVTARAINEAQYTGDYIANGVKAIQFALRDEPTSNNLMVRIGIGDQGLEGAGGNFWLSNDAFTPNSEWTQYSVDLTDASKWTQLFGSGTFEDAIRNTDVLQFRHAPDLVSRQPDSTGGAFGVDNITLLAEVPVVPEPAAGGLFGVLALAIAERRR